MVKAAGAIIRVSTSKQLDGTSPDKQIENILALANRQGYSVKPEHIWQNAESGGLKGDQREGFKKSLRAAEAGEISRVYVFSLDRLGRDLIETLVYLRSLTDRGADCWEAEHGQPLKHDDLVVMILGAVASNERKQILARTRDGMRRSVAEGNYAGGIAAYGFEVNPVTKKLEIDEYEAGVVRDIFRWAIDEHLSCQKIADRLNALNIPTLYTRDNRMLRRAKRAPIHTLNVWRQGQVYRMLKNTSYAGRWFYGKRNNKHDMEPVRGYAPAIISEETFQRAQEELANHRLMNPRNVKHDYLLRGLIYCGLCGKLFSGAGTWKKIESNGKVTEKRISYYYACGGRRRWKRSASQQVCTNVYVRGEKIEDFVWDDVMELCKHPETVIDQLRMTYKPHDNKIDEKIIEASEKLEELNRQELNVLQIATQSKVVNIQSLDTVAEEIRRKQETLQKHISNLQAARERSLNLEREMQNVLEMLNGIAQSIVDATYEEKRNAILALVKNIEVLPKEVDGNLVPYVKIIYRFSESVPEVPELQIDEILGITSHTAHR